MIKIRRVTVSIVVSFFVLLVYKICYNPGNGNGIDMTLLPHTEPNKRHAKTSKKCYWDVMKANYGEKLNFPIFPDFELTN